MDDATSRFLAAFAGRVGLDRDVLRRPGTTLAPREDRAGSGAAVCYWAGAHAVVWCDPAVAGLLTPALAALGPHVTLDAAGFADLASGAGFGHVADADMCVPVRDAPQLTVPAGYHERRLAAAREADVDLVRAFTSRCDPADVEEAALDELDDFAELAVHVLVDDGPSGSHLVAYASGAEWAWDPQFCDIGVLVDVAHRRRGLARVVVAASARTLTRDGRIPLYRHDRANLGSAAVARSLGFEPAVTLSFRRLGGSTT